MRSYRRRAMLLVAALAASAALPAAAAAHGSVRVQQIDGRVAHYDDVRLELSGNTLRVLSPDRVGTLVVNKAACSYVGAMQRCLPSSLTLSQHGTHRITLDRGTVYLNLTSDPQTLPHSSRIVPPRGIVALLRTHRGTFIAITGRLDEVHQ